MSSVPFPTYRISDEFPVVVKKIIGTFLLFFEFKTPSDAGIPSCRRRNVRKRDSCQGSRRNRGSDDAEEVTRRPSHRNASAHSGIRPPTSLRACFSLGRVKAWPWMPPASTEGGHDRFCRTNCDDSKASHSLNPLLARSSDGVRTHPGGVHRPRVRLQSKCATFRQQQRRGERRRCARQQRRAWLEPQEAHELRVRNALRDSLKLSARPLDANGRPMYAPITSLPAEIGQNLTTPSVVELRAYLDTADVLATQYLARALELARCTPSTDETACAQGLVTALGSSLFRGGLTADLTKDLNGLYQTTRSLKDDKGNAASAQEALRVMISGMLASPNFLYLGFSQTVAGARAPLSPIDLAGRLASFFWASGPDDTARAAAASGGLSDDAAVNKGNRPSHRRQRTLRPRGHPVRSAVARARRSRRADEDQSNVGRRGTGRVSLRVRGIREVRDPEG